MSIYIYIYITYIYTQIYIYKLYMSIYIYVHMIPVLMTLKALKVVRVYHLQMCKVMKQKCVMAD